MTEPAARLRRLTTGAARRQAGTVGMGAVLSSRTDRPTFVEAVTQVAAALRSGAAPPVAWRRGLGVRTVDGLPVWADLVERWPDDVAAAQAVLAAARLSVEIGAASAAMLDRIALTLAHEAQAHGRRRAALAGPRATARVLAWLPVLGVLLGVALGAQPWEVLLDGGVGTSLLVGGLALTWVGRRWTGRYLRAAESAGRET